MSMATHAVRAASGGPSTATLALVGVGTFCLANPEKALQLLQRALLTLSDGGSSNGGSSNVSTPTPIVIHAGGNSALGGGGNGSGRGLYYAVLQLSVGAGLCWGSYALLVNILPEQAKNMLPVTQGTFKSAVTSLGKGLLHVKDTLSAEISALLQQQTELGHKQDETHEQVLYVQDQVADVHDDLASMQSSLDDCHKALQTTDKRTTYIARGIRLVTQGMTAMLPPDDELVKELRSFQKSTAENSSLTAPRNKAQDEHEQRRRRGATHNDSNGSRSSSSRRSRRSTSESRRRAASRRNTSAPADTPVRNKPTTTYNEAASPCCSSDTLSVSTGTPVRAVVIPRKTASDDVSITSANPELKELDEVRALLVSMDQRSRLAL